MVTTVSGVVKNYIWSWRNEDKPGVFRKATTQVALVCLAANALCEATAYVICDKVTSSDRFCVMEGCCVYILSCALRALRLNWDQARLGQTEQELKMQLFKQRLQRVISCDLSAAERTFCALRTCWAYVFGARREEQVSDSEIQVRLNKLRLHKVPQEVQTKVKRALKSPQDYLKGSSTEVYNAIAPIVQVLSDDQDVLEFFLRDNNSKKRS